jgi:hypothetical protein
MGGITDVRARRPLDAPLHLNEAAAQSAEPRKERHHAEVHDRARAAGGRKASRAGRLPADALRSEAQKSRAVVTELGTEIQWQQSYVTDDKIYCVFVASGEELVREHARRGEFPLDRVERVVTVIDPTTAEVPVGTAPDS